MTTIYVVRHGETEWNTQRLLQGSSDSPLTENGLFQAKEAAEQFKTVHFAEAFSSDLLRAKRTADIIAAEHNLLVKTSELVRERNFGKYEGKHVDLYLQELRKMIKDLAVSEKKKLKLSSDTESDDEVISRLLLFLRETSVAYPGKNILLVTHSGVIRMLLYHLGYATDAELENLSIKNLAYVQLDCDGNEFFIRQTYNIVKR